MKLGNSLLLSIRALLTLVVPIFLVLTTATAARAAQQFTLLDSFCAQSSCTTGRYPTSLVQATDGNFYSTTLAGGANDNVICSSIEVSGGCGTVFKITASGELTTLYNFCSQPNCSDGALPDAPIIQATDGDFYGTTLYGGANNAGTIFKITPAGELTTLYNFCSQPNCTDGVSPSAPLTQATNGDFYGTTSFGGTVGGCASLGDGCGTVFKITSAGKLTTLYAFCTELGCSDGGIPIAALTQANNGDLYGTTTISGSNPQPGGTVFKITPAGALTTLYELCTQPNCPDGSSPRSALVQAADGDFYGTAYDGGTSIQPAGTAFKITPSGSLTTLYNFCLDCNHGSNPDALIQSTNGELYGMAANGGGPGAGTVFKLTPGGTLTTLFVFCDGSPDCRDGGNPHALIQATSGEFYGVSGGGGRYSGGTIFSLNEGLGPFVALQTTSGRVGSKVTILGTDLTGASSVTFNGTPATFTVNSAGGAITATVPQGATTGTVEVATPGETLKSNKPFKVTS
jgi:uncharacterized repeat protein (TIGR03803 family)